MIHEKPVIMESDPEDQERRLLYTEYIFTLFEVYTICI